MGRTMQIVDEFCDMGGDTVTVKRYPDSIALWAEDELEDATCILLTPALARRLAARLTEFADEFERPERRHDEMGS